MNTERSSISPVALLDGTFYPVHYGHLRCAEEVRKKLGLENLSLLPAGTPPHRDTPTATVTQRLDMLRLACLEFPNLLIDDRETRRCVKRYIARRVWRLLEHPPMPAIAT